MTNYTKEEAMILAKDIVNIKQSITEIFERSDIENTKITSAMWFFIMEDYDNFLAILVLLAAPDQCRNTIISIFNLPLEELPKHINDSYLSNCIEWQGMGMLPMDNTSEVNRKKLEKKGCTCSKIAKWRLRIGK